MKFEAAQIQFLSDVLVRSRHRRRFLSSLWSIFTHVVSIYANLLEQKKVIA